VTQKLSERVEALDKSDNEIDVLVEIVLFEPDDIDAAIRANNAGTKVIYTQHDGKERTYLSGDWTFSAHSREQIAAALRARGL